jgi:hypothetical protein
MLIHGRGWEQAGHRGEDGVDHARVQGAHLTSSHCHEALRFMLPGSMVDAGGKVWDVAHIRRRGGRHRDAPPSGHRSDRRPWAHDARQPGDALLTLRPCRLRLPCRAPRLHGPYPVWTRSINGKTITRSLSPEQADRYQAWFDNTQRLRELVDELKQLALEQAQLDEHWPQS